MRALFPDTNVFLHFLRLDDQAWTEFLPTEECEIVVVSTVVSELDEKKQHPNSKLRKRARAAIEWLLSQRDVNQETLLNGLTLRFHMDEPHSTLKESPNLDPDCRDDRIIASVMEYVRGQGTHSTILSNDAGLLLKAESAGIESFRPPESLLLPDTKTDEEREVEQLRRELSSHLDKTPVLGLASASGDSHVHVSIGPRPEAADDRIPQAVDEERRAILEELGQDNCPPAIEQYLNEFKEWLRISESSYITQLCAFKISLKLTNSGTSRGEHVQIVLTWDAPVSFLSSLPEIPDPPRKPTAARTSWLSQLVDPFPTGRLPDLRRIAQLASHPNARGPFDGPIPHSARFEVDSIQHHLEEPLPNLLLAFESFQKAQDFSLHYEIHAANIPHPTKGLIGVTGDMNRDFEAFVDEVVRTDPA